MVLSKIEEIKIGESAVKNSDLVSTVRFNLKIYINFF
jgi:hypothetical protein